MTQLAFDLAERGAALAADKADRLEWRPVKGLEGFYEVSSVGEIRRVGNIEPRKKGKMTAGYYCVTCYVNNVARHISIHRAVAEAFIPNPEGKRTVNHKDGNKLNNVVSNLEWATHSENSLHSVHVLKHHSAPVMHGTQNSQHRPVYRIDQDGNRTFFATMTEAAKAGYDIRGIYAVCSGEQRSHYGVKWEYAAPPSTATHNKAIVSNIFSPTPG